MLLAAGAGGLLAASCAPGDAEDDAPRSRPSPQAEEVARGLRKLERQHSARVGVFARNMRTGTTLVHRADERFPLCSTWKPLAVAAVLAGRGKGAGKGAGKSDGEDGAGDGGEALLDARVRYSEDDLEEHSPVTGTREHLDHGMTLGQLCDAAVRQSDNTAANLLLRELDGPAGVTRFCRSLDDRVTRLDRWETELNSAEPGRTEDTTSPRAVARTYARLVLGDALEPPQRRRLTDWLKRNTTGDDSLRAGLPEGWSIGEKTGSGAYGTNNDVGVAWAGKDRTPVVLAVYTTKHSAGAEPDYPLIAAATRLLCPSLV
ncbi:class A beta-lactamase [Streptomyces nanshensis]|uniref:Beta-lactamase n=1 Tax=Streptomyces nanshensis TaxID=518642 RepID=A0A1E7KV91_9ACTN|nr:class A beta-lactamase [Streptomyces nanshensis]OEV07822.1 hypothetical protein AN218_28495 [Streptomyces nanshensis]